jgi:hypothetical protein
MKRDAKKLVASIKDGVDLTRLEIGTILEVQTKNTLYKLRKLENGEYEVEGGMYLSPPHKKGINGSTFGGSMIKINWIGLSMNIEFTDGPTTTEVQSIKIIAPDAKWDFSLP